MRALQSPWATMPGAFLMKRPLIALAALLASLVAGVAVAQSAPLRGVGMLALNAADATNVPGSRNALMEASDSGGGGGAALRSTRGSGDVNTARHSTHEAAEAVLPDALPSVGVHAGDPAAPVVATPKRPTYRWQSLVPGAIK